MKKAKAVDPEKIKGIVEALSDLSKDSTVPKNQEQMGNPYTSMCVTFSMAKRMPLLLLEEDMALVQRIQHRP